MSDFISGSLYFPPDFLPSKISEPDLSIATHLFIQIFNLNPKFIPSLDNSHYGQLITILAVAYKNPRCKKAIDYIIDIFKSDLHKAWIPYFKFQYWEKTESRGIDVSQKKKRKVANSIANKLLNHKNCGSHGRSIKIDDLEKIGLKIIRIDEDPDWSDLIYRIQIIIKFIFSNSASFKLFVYNGNLISQKAMERNSLKRVPIPKLSVPVITQIDVLCQKCGKVYNVYAKLKKDKKIDEEMKKKGLIPYPSDDKIICSCGFEIDLLPIRNQIESETRQPFII